MGTMTYHVAPVWGWAGPKCCISAANNQPFHNVINSREWRIIFIVLFSLRNDGNAICLDQATWVGHTHSYRGLDRSSIPEVIRPDRSHSSVLLR